MTRHTALLSLVLGSFGSVQTIHANAFLDVNGVFTTIDVPGSAPGSTLAFGINNLGQSVGQFADAGGEHGFLDTNGVFTTIDVPGGLVSSSQPLGINDAGQVVGAYLTPSGATNGFLWTNGVFDLAPFGLSGINNSGQLVVSGGVLTNGVLTTFSFPGALVTVPTGINNLGQVVGVFTPPGGPPVGRIFVYSNGVYSEIEPPGGVINFARGINDLGQIVGTFVGVTAPHRVS